MKNWKTKTVSTLLALSVLVPSAAFAADAVNSTGEEPKEKGFAHHQFFNKENHQEFNDRLLELVSKYTPESLEEWENVLAQQDQLMNDLKDKNPVDKQRLQLSTETKEKINAIREDVKNGKLTPEQAQEQLKSLGIEKSGDKEGFRVKIKLSDEAKEKLKALQEDIKNGKITKEQAKEEMSKLGLKPRGNFDKDSLMMQFRDAVESNDETKIKELLPQMLEQMKEKSQALSNKLAEANQ